MLFPLYNFLLGSKRHWDVVPGDRSPASGLLSSLGLDLFLNGDAISTQDALVHCMGYHLRSRQIGLLRLLRYRRDITNI